MIIDIPITVLKYPFPSTSSTLDHKEKIASLMNEKWWLIGFFWHFPDYQWGYFYLFLHPFLHLIFSSGNMTTFVILKGVPFFFYSSSSFLLLLMQAQAHRWGLLALIGPPKVKCPFLSLSLLGDRRTYHCGKVSGILLTGFLTALEAGDWVNSTVLMTTAD